MARRHGWALLGFAALTLILTWPVVPTAADHQLGGGNDPWLFIWTIGWNVHALTTAPWAIFDANIFYPHPNTLAYSEHLIGTAPFAAPVVWLTGNHLLATNVVALLSVFVGGFGAYLLGRRLGLAAGAAFLAGVIFAFTPPRLERIDQLHLITIHWIPFALASLHAYFQTGRARDLRWAAAFLSLQALTSGHGTAMLALGAALLIGHRFLTGEPLALSKRVRDIGIPGALLLAPVALMLVPYLRAQSDVGLVRVLDDAGVSAVSWIRSSSHVDEFLFSRLPSWTWLQAEPDAYLFPGILPLLLAAAAFRLPRSAARDGAPIGRLWRWGALALSLLALSQIIVGVFVAIDGGVRLRVGGRTLLSAHGWAPWLYAAIAIAARAALLTRVPFAAWGWVRSSWPAARASGTRGLYLTMLLVTIWLTIGPPLGLWQWVYWIPGLSFIRVPSRFMLLGFLALGILAAIGFGRLTARLKPGKQRTALAVVVLLLAGEFAFIPIGVRPYTVVTPPIDLWLATQPKPFSVVELPIPPGSHVAITARRNLIYMLHSMAHFQPLVQGYSGTAPPGYVERERLLMRFPDEASVRMLAELGVTYASVHIDAYTAGELVDVEAGLARLVDDGWLRLAHAEAGGRVYTIHRPQ
jgi:asparagine N-glycosylation enzyme membrane subunit Stt3